MASLWLHGLPFHAGVWRPLWGARPAAGRLAVDLPGYGGSAPLGQDWSVAAHADWLEALARAAGLGSWDQLRLIGHEYGGLLAAELAARHGARSLTLLSTTLGPSWLWARVAAWPGLHRVFYRWHGGVRYRDHAVGPAHRAGLAQAFPLPGTRAFADQMRATGRQFSAGHLRGLVGRLQARAVPTRLVWGTADRTFPLVVGRRLARALDAPLITIQGARHLGIWTHPEAFAAAVDAPISPAGVGAG